MSTVDLEKRKRAVKVSKVHTALKLSASAGEIEQ